MEASPNSWLPGAEDVRLCLTSVDRPGVLVGVYDDPPPRVADRRNTEGQHGYAPGGTLKDECGCSLSSDPAPLRSLDAVRLRHFVTRYLVHRRGPRSW